MKIGEGHQLNRRELITQAAPACALTCLGLWGMPEALAATTGRSQQEVHKFDETEDMQLSRRNTTEMQHRKLLEFIRDVRTELGDDELIRLLKIHSTAVGQRTGENQARNSPDSGFQSFVAVFRPPRYYNALTHVVVEDTETTFELRVTECVWASVFRDAGLDGEIGHAAVCNMDYAWPKAFNPDFRMERSRTLMQGDDHCNHRYINTVGPE